MRLRIAPIVVTVAIAALAVPAGEIDQHVADELADLGALFRHLHAHPELSYHERETAARIAAELRAAGFDVTESVGDYGVPDRTAYGLVGVLRNGDGPVVMLRTDLDALPVEERTDLPWRSEVRVPGEDGGEIPVMHACGHDLHMSAFVGAARVLSAMRDRWSGTLVLVGQPAEERGAGARAMLADGLFERFPKPDYVLTQHADPSHAAGTVGVIPGYAMASVDSVDVVIRGRGGHGALPHTTIDPVVIAARFVTDLQSLVSRRVSPFDPAVVTVGSIHGGTKHNIIPDEVRMQLTVRAYGEDVRTLLLDGIAAIADSAARAADVPEELLPVVTLREEEHCPATYNDPELTERLAATFRDALGEAHVVRVEPVTPGEDFARYGPAADAPAMLFWLGAAPAERIEAAASGGPPPASLHSAEFEVDPEPAIRTGATALVAAVLDLAGR